MSSTYKAVIVGTNFKKALDGTPLSYDTYKVLGGAEINCIKKLFNKALFSVIKNYEVIPTCSELSKIKQVYPDADYNDITGEHDIVLSMHKIYREDVENLIKAVDEDISNLNRQLTINKEDLISRIKNSIVDESIPREKLRERTAEVLSVFDEDRVDIEEDLEDYKYLLEDLNRIKSIMEFYDSEYYGFTSEESYDEIVLLVIKTY
jgi:hypothetical protein